ncbi:MAG: hypothetical protein LBC99_05265 [Spirochaetota bacterium]|jgi:hypothetical protein|nr:hypothetical protein [Spirochaetota bacterium]
MRFCTTFILLALCLCAYAAEDVRAPKEPTEPFIDSMDDAAEASADGKNSTTVVTNAQTQKRQARWRIRAFYVDGRMVEGLASFAYTEYVTDFFEGQNRYYRKLSLAETASIRVNRWKPVLSKAEEDRQLYYFMPELYRIIARDGEIYRLDKRMKMLDMVELSTQRGNTRIYMYFADYWLGEEEEEGQWENSGSRDFDYNAVHPNPETVYRIDFIAEE